MEGSAATTAAPQPVRQPPDREHSPSKKQARVDPPQPPEQAGPRPRLFTVSTLPDAIAALRSAKRVMVLVGAGISVSCGVPDFRSENGLYALVERLGLALDDPQDLFSIEAFDDDATNFYAFAHALWPGDSIQVRLLVTRFRHGFAQRFSLAFWAHFRSRHRAAEPHPPVFSRAGEAEEAAAGLHPEHRRPGEGTILTTFDLPFDRFDAHVSHVLSTFEADVRRCLAQAAGLPSSLLVECHGSLNTARCRDCRKTCAAAE